MLSIIEWKRNKSGFIVIVVKILDNIFELRIFEPQLSVVIIEFVSIDAKFLSGDLHEGVGSHCQGHTFDELLYLIASSFVLMIVRQAM